MMPDRRRLRVSVFIWMALTIAFAVLAAGCITSVEPRSVPSGASPDPTATPAPIQFATGTPGTPNDEFAHDARLEWWYYSGHLDSESGREFGFHFVVFKALGGTGEPNLVAQLGLLDVETGEHFELYRARAGFTFSVSANTNRPGLLAQHALAGIEGAEGPRMMRLVLQGNIDASVDGSPGSLSQPPGR